MLQFDRSGSQMMCLVRGRGCIVLAVTLLITLLVNIALLMVVINTEIYTGWRGEERGGVLDGPGDLASVAGGVATAKPPTFQQFYKKHFNNVTRRGEKAAGGEEVRTIRDPRVGGVTSKRLPVIAPRANRSALQVAVYTSARPRTRRPAEKRTMKAIPYVVSQAAKFTGMQLRFPDKRFDLEAVTGAEGLGRKKVARAERQKGQNLGGKHRNSEKPNKKHRRRRPRDVEAHTTAEILPDAQPDAQGEPDNIQDGPTDTEQEPGEERKLTRQERRRLRKQYRAMLSRATAGSTTAAEALHSLSSVPTGAADMLRKAEERYPAYVPRNAQKSDLRRRSGGATKKDRKRRKGRRGGKKETSEGAAFSNKDLRTFKKYLRKVENKKSREQPAGSRRESSRRRDRVSRDERVGQDSKAESDTKDVHYEFNLDHRTDEDWEANEDMSHDHLLRADRKKSG